MTFVFTQPLCGDGKHVQLVSYHPHMVHPQGRTSYTMPILFATNGSPSEEGYVYQRDKQLKMIQINAEGDKQAEYVCVTLSGDELQLMSVTKSPSKRGRMSCLSTNRLNLLSQYMWERDFSANRPKGGIDDAVASVLQRARSLYTNWVGAIGSKESQQEKQLSSEYGFVTCHMQSGGDLVNTTPVVTLMTPGSDWCDWDTVGELNQKHLGDLEGALSDVDMTHWKANGGDPELMVVEANEMAVARFNQLVEAAILTERAALYKLNCCETDDEYDKNLEVFNLRIEEISKLTPLALGGGLFCDNSSRQASLIHLLRYNPVTMDEKTSMYVISSIDNKVCELPPRGVDHVTVSNKYLLSMKPTIKSVVVGNHGRSILTGQFITQPTETMRRILRRPNTLNAGSLVYEDDTLHQTHSGAVPLRIIGKNIYNHIDSDSHRLSKVLKYDMVTLAKYSGSFMANARIFRPVQMNSVSATHTSHSAFPYTMSIYTNNTNNANNTTSAMANMITSTLDDYSVILDRGTDTLLVQHDCCLPDGNTLTEYESNRLRDNILLIEANSPNKMVPDFPSGSLDNCRDFKTLCTRLCACTGILSRLTVDGQLSSYDCDQALQHFDPASKEAVALNAFIDSCRIIKQGESRVLNCNAYSKIKPMPHSAELGKIKEVHLLATNGTNASTNNRVVVLVKHAQRYLPDDYHVLFIDRRLGTDPEFFSTDSRMAFQELQSASSVRQALGIDPADNNVVLGSAWREHIEGKMKLASHDTKNIATFAVQWKPTSVSDWKTSLLQVTCANRHRNDQIDPVASAARIITVSMDNQELYSVYNSDWKIQRLIDLD